uniref:Uncharacterized protein n=1 Tax=Daphnia galeata TaxID=27404 RepID=A0A8J2WCN6_9CRUS|nr:unnamed protein product [Daphnia galeata]
MKLATLVMPQVILVEIIVTERKKLNLKEKLLKAMSSIGLAARTNSDGVRTRVLQFICAVNGGCLKLSLSDNVYLSRLVELKELM